MTAEDSETDAKFVQILYEEKLEIIAAIRKKETS